MLDIIPGLIAIAGLAVIFAIGFARYNYEIYQQTVTVCEQHGGQYIERARLCIDKNVVIKEY